MGLEIYPTLLLPCMAWEIYFTCQLSCAVQDLPQSLFPCATRVLWHSFASACDAKSTQITANFCLQSEIHSPHFPMCKTYTSHSSVCNFDIYPHHLFLIHSLMCATQDPPQTLASVGHSKSIPVASSHLQVKIRLNHLCCVQLEITPNYTHVWTEIHPSHSLSCVTCGLHQLFISMQGLRSVSTTHFVHHNPKLIPMTVQFSSRWYLCARKSPSAHHTVTQKFSQCFLRNSSNVRPIDDGPLSSFQGRSSSASSFHASLLPAIDGVMPLSLCLQVVSQAPQHSRSSVTQTIWDGCMAHQSICLVISLHSGMSRAAHPQRFSKVDAKHRHASLGFPFHFLYQAHWICKDDGTRWCTHHSKQNKTNDNNTQKAYTSRAGQPFMTGIQTSPEGITKLMGVPR